jgi:hypothetical protein
MPHRIYFWRIKDIRGRWYKTRYRTDEESIRKEHPEAQLIEAGSMEIRDFDPRQDRYSPTMQGRP